MGVECRLGLHRCRASNMRRMKGRAPGKEEKTASAPLSLGAWSGSQPLVAPPLSHLSNGAFTVAAVEEQVALLSLLLTAFERVPVAHQVAHHMIVGIISLLRQMIPLELPQVIRRHYSTTSSVTLAVSTLELGLVVGCPAPLLASECGIHRGLQTLSLTDLLVGVSVTRLAESNQADGAVCSRASFDLPCERSG